MNRLVLKSSEYYCNKTRAAILFCLVFLTSCISNPAYPPEWPDFSVDRYEDCPKISGVYIDKAYEAFGFHEQKARDPQDNRLSLHQPLRYLYKTGTKVKIAQSSEEELEFSLLDDDTVIIKKNYSKQAGDFHCDGTELKFSRWEDLGRSNILGLAWEGTTFRKGVDGSLVVKTQARVAGLVLLIAPIVVFDRVWYRYVRTDY